MWKTFFLLVKMQIRNVLPRKIKIQMSNVNQKCIQFEFLFCYKTYKLRQNLFFVENRKKCKILIMAKRRPNQAKTTHKDENLSKCTVYRIFRVINTYIWCKNAIFLNKKQGQESGKIRINCCTEMKLGSKRSTNIFRKFLISGIFMNTRAHTRINIKNVLG